MHCLLVHFRHEDCWSSWSCQSLLQHSPHELPAGPAISLFTFHILIIVNLNGIRVTAVPDGQLTHILTQFINYLAVWTRDFYWKYRRIQSYISCHWHVNASILLLKCSYFFAGSFRDSLFIDLGSPLDLEKRSGCFMIIR